MMTPFAPPAELASVADFLRQSLPFDVLDETQLQTALAALKIIYHPKAERFTADTQTKGLRILRSGAVDLRNDSNKLLDRLGEGESFHIDGLNADAEVVHATVIEDALIYLLPDATYQTLRAANRDFDRYFSRQRSRRLRRAARYLPDDNPLLAPVRRLMSQDLLCVPPETPVQSVAAAMTERRVSSVFVTEDGQLLGIVTDRDLRSRCLAPALPMQTPVREIMTANPESIDENESVFSVTLRMTQRGYHHLPVLSEGSLAGIVTTSDLILARRNDPVYLVQHLSRQDSVAGLRELLTGLPDQLLTWVQSGMRAEQVSQLLTAISDAVTLRLIQLAERELGPAPGPWAWLAFGSQAREEQLLGAD